MTLGQGSQTQSCRFCGASLIFRGQTSCQSCGRDLGGRTEPGRPVPLSSAAEATGPAAEGTVEAAPLPGATAAATEAPTPAPGARAPVRFFQSARMPPPTPLPPSVRLNDTSAPTSTAAPTAPTITPGDAGSGTAGAVPRSTVAPLMGGASDAGQQAFAPVPPPHPAPRAQPAPRRVGRPPQPGWSSRPPAPPGTPPDARWQGQGYWSGRGRRRGGYSNAGDGSGWNSCATWIGLGIIAIAIVAFILNAAGSS